MTGRKKEMKTKIIGILVCMLFITSGLASVAVSLNETPVATISDIPVACYTYSPTFPEPGETVTFDSSCSYDPDGTIVQRSWDFENDGVDDSWDIVATHAYPVKGVYDCELWVIDDDGDQKTLHKFIPVSKIPVATFTYSPTSPKAGETVTFDSSASYDPDGTIVQRSWDFENDGVDDSWDIVATHTYPSVGTYDCELWVKDDTGSEKTQHIMITVPKSHSIEDISIHNFFLQFLENHPNLFPILKHLLL